MYKLRNLPLGGQDIQHLADNTFAPFCPDNTDYQRFKQDIADGAELLDAEGNKMTSDQVNEFIKTLL